MERQSKQRHASLTAKQQATLDQLEAQRRESQERHEADRQKLVTEQQAHLDGLPEEHRSESFIRNEGGWTSQVENVKRHVDG